MKRSGLISLICSLVAVMVLCLSVVLILVFTNVIDVVSEELVISSASATATYDGETLIDQDWSLLKGELQENHRLSVVVSGSQTNVGMSENYIFAKVIDNDGNDVSDDYNIVYEPGTLSVKQRAITVTADSKMKLFDGRLPRTSVRRTQSQRPNKQLRIASASGDFSKRIRSGLHIRSAPKYHHRLR